MKLKLTRKKIFSLWIISLFLWVCVCLYPIQYGIVRLSIVMLTLLVYLGGIYLYWKHKIIKNIALSLGIILLIFISLPGRSFDTSQLRQLYVQELKSYEGIKYAWGGENRIGIDCSGLVRQGLIHTNFKQSFLSFNPALLRNALSLWWNDTSAEALKDEYKNYTKRGESYKSINDINYDLIQPGDLAVTSNGVHILAYLGNQQWIEADPITLKVNTNSAPQIDKAFFNVPIFVLQWQQFT